jgi:hypothetical protein
VDGQDCGCFAADLFEVFQREDRVCYWYVFVPFFCFETCARWFLGTIWASGFLLTDMIMIIGKIGMSVLTKGLAMDFIRQERTNMAITSIWPAAVCLRPLFLLLALLSSGPVLGVSTN